MSAAAFRAPPGAPPRETGLDADLAAALARLGPDHAPRTRHLHPDGAPIYVNRLIGEPSPYLRQHAHNPVDWRPWGDAAFAEAEARDLPVFLSVGYATCHWCHVMEEGSFDDEEAAEVLNRLCVPVKLDREQRPDLDQVYIAATQIQQRHAGWPNSLWLTPGGKPFHTGTYFPKPQFIATLNAVAQAWASDRRGEILEVADRLAEMIAGLGAARRAAAVIGPETAGAASGQLSRMANDDEGGFSPGTQFPQEGFLLFLLDHWRRTGDDRAWDMAARALDGIAAGGIHDHVGGGFHRYSVDVNWRTPHFEKMLYNQGRLAQCFIEGWDASGDPLWRRAAERCFAYLLRDMTAPDGAFYAAEDADSRDARGEMEEGAFYVWDPAEAADALGPEDGPWAAAALGLGEAPTLEAGPVAHLRPGAVVDMARLDPLLERLRLARDARARPLRDEKVIAGWNGLAIRALAAGALAFGRPDLGREAARAMEAVLARLWSDEGGLSKLSAAGLVVEHGGLEDYAWLGLAAIALQDWAEAVGDAPAARRWGDLAARLTSEMLTRFDAGREDGRLAASIEETPMGRVFDTEDGAVPAGQSSAMELIAAMEARAPDQARRTRADRLLAALSGGMAEHPTLRTDALRAAMALQAGESTASRALAGGAVRVRAMREAARVAFEITVAPGWSLAGPGDGPGDARLAAEAGALLSVDWPPAESGPAFAGAPAAVLRGAVGVEAALADPVGPAALALTLRPCSGEACLLPVEARFRWV